MTKHRQFLPRLESLIAEVGHFTVNLRGFLRLSRLDIDSPEPNQPRRPVRETGLGFFAAEESQAPCQARGDG